MRRSPNWTVQETLLAADAAGTLFLKVCGFIDEHSVRIVDSWDDGLALRFPARLGLFSRGIDIQLRFRPLDLASPEAIANGASARPDWQRTQARQTLVDVCMRPTGWFSQGHASHPQIRKALWLLRWHLFA